jgi:hypothetical protein
MRNLNIIIFNNWNVIKIKKNKNIMIYEYIQLRFLYEEMHDYREMK